MNNNNNNGDIGIDDIVNTFKKINRFLIKTFKKILEI